jgi:hypothetical protein
MEICECGKLPNHHPSEHYREKRDALMQRVEAFMDEVYPADIFKSEFNRKQVALIAACFVLDNHAPEIHAWKLAGALEKSK